MFEEVSRKSSDRIDGEKTERVIINKEEVIIKNDTPG